MLARNLLITQIDNNPGTVTITTRELAGGSRLAISANEAYGDNACTYSGCSHFVVVEVEQGLVGVYQRYVLPSVTIIV